MLRAVHLATIYRGGSTKLHLSVDEGRTETHFDALFWSSPQEEDLVPPTH